jgi:hypothetical protein
MPLADCNYFGFPDDVGDFLLDKQGNCNYSKNGPGHGVREVFSAKN